MRPSETRVNGVNLEQKCGGCKEFKPLIDFSRDASRPYGVTSQCRECNKKYYQKNKLRIRDVHKQYRENNKEKVAECRKSWELESRYNLTKKQLEKLSENGCEVCGSFDRLHVDHDHITNTVRGILCQKCNIALGH